jgi:EAL domain-containing protein (putative c-di-GMP-specific phosphodiesterase class I)
MAVVAERIGKWVRHLLLDDEPENTGAPAGKVSTREADEAGTQLEDVERKLSNLLKQQGIISAGVVQMIGLGRLKTELGEDWPRLSDRVRMAARKIIERHVSRDDVFAQVSDEDYVIVFAGLSQQLSQVKCAVIAEELYAHFLGDKLAGKVEIKSVVGEVDGELLTEPASLENLREAIVHMTRAVRETDDNEQDFKTWLFGLQDASRFDVRDQLPDALKSPAWREFSIAANASPAEATQAVLRRVAAMSDDAMEIKFRPVWDLHHEVISAYIVTPVKALPGGGVLELYKVLKPGPEPDDYFRLDLDVMDVAIQSLDEAKREGKNLFVVTPVHYETLAAVRFRESYLAVCRALPHHVRASLIFDIFGLPPGMPQSRLLDVLGTIKPFARAMIANVPIESSALSGFKDVGLLAVGARVENEPARKRDQTDQLARLTAAARQAGLVIAISNVSTKAELLACHDLGCTFVSGDAVSQPVDSLGNVRPYKWRDHGVS